MQGLLDRIFESKSLTFVAAGVALLLAAALALFAFRLVLGRRVKAPGGRARAPRLGVVEAFDLDRQRQLVIIRRDNVEHLLMIGGPNDLVVEAEIIRAEARERTRDKDLRGDKEPMLAPVPAPSPAPAAPAPGWPAKPDVAARAAARSKPGPTPDPLAPTLTVEEAQPAENDPVPVATPAPSGLAATRPIFPTPPRRPLPAGLRPRDPPLRADLAHADLPRSDSPRPDAAARLEAGTPASTFPRSSLATPFLRPPRQLAETLGRQQDAGGRQEPLLARPLKPADESAPAPSAMAKTAPADIASDREPAAVGKGISAEGLAMAAESAEGPAPAAVAPQTGAAAEEQAPPASARDRQGESPAPQPAPANPTAFDSLEEEMAKLLGR